jgi:hypothetical protein
MMVNRLYNKRTKCNISCADYTIVSNQGNKMAAKTNVLISKMERSRERLNSVLEKATPQVEIYPTWKLKQVLDHITGWDELVISALRSYSHSETPAVMVKDGIDHYNAESVNARKALSFEQSRQAYDAARKNVIQILQELPPEMLTQRFPAPWGGMCTIPSVVKIFVSHEAEHAKHIEEILSKKAAGT